MSVHYVVHCKTDNHRLPIIVATFNDGVWESKFISIPGKLDDVPCHHCNLAHSYTREEIFKINSL
jgi:hypothetical protein